MNRVGGRKPGVPNKVTADIRDKFQTLIENNMERLQEDLNKMKPVYRVKAMIELAKFVLPTLKAVEVDTSDKFQQIILNLGSGERPEDD